MDDEDGDGVLDDDDDCPFTDPEETVNGNGCSEGQLSVLDTDNDGVSNLNDLCLNTAANVSVDTSGCELPAEMMRRCRVRCWIPSFRET